MDVTLRGQAGGLVLGPKIFFILCILLVPLSWLSYYTVPSQDTAIGEKKSVQRAHENAS